MGPVRRRGKLITIVFISTHLIRRWRSGQGGRGGDSLGIEGHVLAEAELVGTFQR